MRQWIAVIAAEAALLFAVSLLSSGPTQAASFSQPYRDGAVIVLWQSGYTDAQIDAIIARAQKAGVRSIEVPFFGCQSDITSSDVGSCQMGSWDQPMQILKRAVAAGLSVSVLPIVATPKWDWRGLFDPTDVDGWFKTYTAWLSGLAEQVRVAGASELIVGSEFKILYQYGAQWTQLLHDLRPVFPGPLIVTANWDNFDYSFWADSDAIGISSYYPLASQDNPDPDQSDLEAAWSSWKSKLLAVSQQWNRPLYFTEVGYNSTVSAAVTPWGGPSDSAQDLELQARCFTAMQTAWESETKLIRANVWAIGDPSSEGNGQQTFDFIGTPAEGVLSAFYAARSALGLNF